jgi:hypothetical protein
MQKGGIEKTTKISEIVKKSLNACTLGGGGGGEL